MVYSLQVYLTLTFFAGVCEFLQISPLATMFTETKLREPVRIQLLYSKSLKENFPTP